MWMFVDVSLYVRVCVCGSERSLPSFHIKEI